MKNLFILLSVFSISLLSAQSSAFDWVTREGGGNSEGGNNKIRRAPNGDLYTIMSFTNSTVVNGNTINALGGGSNFVVAKYDVNGIFQWSKHMYGTENFSTPQFDVDGSGNLYLAASFGGTITFMGNNYTRSSTWGDAQCLLKIDNAGTLLWGQIATITTGMGNYIRMGVKPNGEVILIGWIPQGDTLIINGLNVKAFNSAGETFYACFNSNGTYNWHSMNENGSVLLDSDNIRFDNSGLYMYVSGSYSDAHTFANNGASISASLGGQDMYLAKIQVFAFAHCMWAKSIGSSTNDHVEHIEVDDNGNVIIAGTVSSDCAIEGNAIDVIADNSLVVISYNSSGVSNYARTIADVWGSIYTPELKKDIAGNIYLSGQYTDSVSFGTSSLKTNGNHDALLIKIKASNGLFQWAKGFGGSGQSDFASACAFNENEIYVTGRFSNVCAFGDNIQYTSNGGTDFFVAKLSGCDFPTVNVTNSGSTTLCNGQSISLSATNLSGATYQWLSNNSTLPNANNDSITIATSGVYSVDVDLGGVCRDTFGFVNVVVSNINAVIQSANPSICPGSDMQLYTSLPFTNYNWSTGVNSPSIVINQQGTYSVTVSDGAGCLDTASIIVSEYPQPTMPTVLVGANCQLASSVIVSGYSYKWRLNGSIVGGNSAYLDAGLHGSGFYTIEITDLNGCKASSITPVSVTCLTGISELANFKSIKVYPNPMKDILTIETPILQNNDLKFYLLDLTGSIVVQKILRANENLVESLNLSSLSCGLYTGIITSEFTTQSFKIIKQ